MSLSFAGRVAIVTGAGGGLGKQYALLLAKKGASVVVNDLGGTAAGEGSSSSAADIVVNEIKKDGGKAVANYDSVENAENILRTALDSFGRIDILINNAGILRDRSFARISDQDWDLVHRIHLRSAFLLSRAAWPHFRKQNYGRIIMTTSVSGIYGNFGQANYSAAKLGLVGLSNTLAIEGAKYNIHCNTIAPTAASRLTQDLMPPDLLEELKPEYIAPVVVWLCHESCEDNGSVIEAAGGWFGKFQWYRSKGEMLRSLDKKPTVESVRDSWNSITDMKDAFHLNSTQDTMGVLIDVMTKAKDRIVPSKIAAKDIDPDVAIGQKTPRHSFSYNAKDVILYALGVATSTTEPDALRYLYENSSDFAPLPTFGIVPAQMALFESGIVTGGVEGLKVNVAQLLHGEQYLEVLQPLLPEDKIESEASVTDVLDKGSGAVIIVDVVSYRDRQPVLRNQFSLFIVGAGNFGGKRASDKAVPNLDPPSRQPDKVVKVVTSVDQAVLYRLSGDLNPLHIDPDFSAILGFKRPILHGLCTYGIVGREVIKAFAGNDPSKFRAMKVRFVKPIVPGQTLQIEMWQERDRVFTTCKNLDTGAVVLSGAYVDLVPGTGNSVIRAHNIDADNSLKSSMFFDVAKEQLANDPSLPEKVNALYLWKILKNGKEAAQWTLDLRRGKGPGRCYSGEPEEGKAQCTMCIEDDDLLALATGQLDPQKAFFTGKLKITGNIMLTRKLETLFKAHQSKL